MSVVISPNMNLPVPVVGVEPGPNYASDVNNSLTIIDGHTHNVGSGVAITPSAININTDLTFAGQNATTLKTVRFQPQASAIASTSPNVGCLFVATSSGNNELFYNDSSGNQVQITLAGVLNATSSGIASGTASAAFSGGVLVVNAATNTPANIQVASVLLGNNVASSKFLTLSPPNAMGANYSLVLPGIPGSTSFMTLDTSGNMGASISTASGITGSNITSNVNLAGKAVQENGLNVVVSNTNATNSLAIIRGCVDASGSIISGEGFTVSRPATGTFNITFSSAFADLPAVIATPATSGDTATRVGSSPAPSTSTVTIYVGSSNATPNNFPFNFIAIGQRA